MGSLIKMLWAAALCITVAASAAAAAKGPRINSISLAFLDEGSSTGSVDVEWEAEPSGQDVSEEWTKDLYARAYAHLQCNMSPEGLLADCKIRRYFPENGSTEQFFMRLVDRFKASPAFVSQYGRHVTRVSMLVKVENSAGRPVENIPCPSPLCTITPPPPPPPPPPLGEKG